MTARDVGLFFGRVFLVLGVPILILAFFGFLVLLLSNPVASGIWEVASVVHYIPFLAWGMIFSFIGTVLVLLSYRNE